METKMKDDELKDNESELPKIEKFEQKYQEFTERLFNEAVEYAKEKQKRKYQIELLLNIDNKLHRQIESLASKHNVSFNAVLEALVTKGRLDQHLVCNALFSRPVNYKPGRNIVVERIQRYENRENVPDPYIIEVELSKNIDYYGHNPYQEIEQLASAYSTSFDTMLAVLINDGLERYLKSNIHFVRVIN